MRCRKSLLRARQWVVGGQFEIDLASWLGSLGRSGCLSVICLPQSSACQRSLVEVRPTIPVYTPVGSAGLYVRRGLHGASNPWRSAATRRTLRGLMVVRTSLVPSPEYAPRTVRFPVNNPATIKLTHYPPTAVRERSGFPVCSFTWAGTGLLPTSVALI
jgi:hypothetical protein